jgi:hypothetical protein
MRDSIDKSVAKELSCDPCDHTSRAAAGAKGAFRDMTDECRFQSAELWVGFDGIREELLGKNIFVLAGGRERAYPGKIRSSISHPTVTRLRPPLAEAVEIHMDVIFMRTRRTGTASDTEAGANDISRAHPADISRWIRMPAR